MHRCVPGTPSTPIDLDRASMTRCRPTGVALRPSCCACHPIPSAAVTAMMVGLFAAAGNAADTVVDRRRRRAGWAALDRLVERRLGRRPRPAHRPHRQACRAAANWHPPLVHALRAASPQARAWSCRCCSAGAPAAASRRRRVRLALQRSRRSDDLVAAALRDRLRRPAGGRDPGAARPPLAAALVDARRRADRGRRALRQRRCPTSTTTGAPGSAACRTGSGGRRLSRSSRSRRRSRPAHRDPRRRLGSAWRLVALGAARRRRGRRPRGCSAARGGRGGLRRDDLDRGHRRRRCWRPVRRFQAG